MGPTKRNMQPVPSLADRIKASNNSPLEPTKRSLNETKQVDRDRLVRNFIRLYCRELAIRPLMIQAVAEARATNLEIINIYGRNAKASRDNEASKADEIEHNETIFPNKCGKSKKQSTRRLKDIDSNGTTLADLVNGLTIQSKQGCSDLIKDTDDEAHKDVFIDGDLNLKASSTSLILDVITRQSLKGTKTDTNDILVENPDKPSEYDATNLMINDTIFPHANSSVLDISDNCASELPHANIIEQNDGSIPLIRDSCNKKENRVSSISWKPKRQLVPRYKDFRQLENTNGSNIDNEPFSSDLVDNLKQPEDKIRPISSLSTVTVLPASETDEGVTTEDIASSSEAFPDMERKLTESPVPLKLNSKIHTPRALSFHESNNHNKFSGIFNKGKQDILTENYFSDTPVLRSRNVNQINQDVQAKKFNKTDIHFNRNRINQVIDDQTRKTLVQNQLKKFGFDGNPRGSQKNHVSSWKSNININTRTALNDRFLTMSDQFSSKTDPFQEFPKKLGWFLKSGELDYDERYTFEDKRRTKSKAYMNVQRQHYKRRTLDAVPKNRQQKTQIQLVTDRRQDIFTPGKPFYNQEPRTPIITKRLRFMKRMVTKPLHKRKPFITVV
ncbi:hypothetical protein LOTGIDRAFT_157017 [Lottia gigantea]|uniref:Uncharacterized protein n=1 Tax=Lottia gigantea TaxID=225164 RepID=V4B688_LOTGI|nr:hypothetical protein LOTGIDRAFT_157017 [Lottia gigantea]ESP03056.1 hypothetical protein LOTGIDRAFT_157017 [Lottia gigantea]